ncbi:hypothetical protein D3C76_1528740 [compost metagenome]
MTVSVSPSFAVALSAACAIGARNSSEKSARPLIPENEGVNLAIKSVFPKYLRMLAGEDGVSLPVKRYPFASAVSGM